MIKRKPDKKRFEHSGWGWSIRWKTRRADALIKSISSMIEKSEKLAELIDPEQGNADSAASSLLSAVEHLKAAVEVIQSRSQNGRYAVGRFPEEAQKELDEWMDRECGVKHVDGMVP